MNIPTLLALSPGWSLSAEGNCSASFFSEYALIRKRVYVEIEWFKAVTGIPDLTGKAVLSDEAIACLDALYKNFSVNDAAAVKAIEARTNHDVKAVEYWLKEQLAEHQEIAALSEFFTLPVRRKISITCRMAGCLN